MSASLRGFPRWLALLGLGLYVLVLAASPLLHHDFACHVKTPGHCDACAANPLAPRTEHAVGLGAARLLDAGHVQLPDASAPRAQGLVPRSGRAPPA